MCLASLVTFQSTIDTPMIRRKSLQIKPTKQQANIVIIGTNLTPPDDTLAISKSEINMS